MEKVAQYIKDHAAAFDEEPQSGHYERFQQKQQRAHRQKRVRMLARLAAAACIAVMLSLGIVYRPAAPDNRVTLCENSHDMQGCYLSQLTDMAAEIERLTQNLDTWNRTLVADEVGYIMLSAEEIESLLPETLPADENNKILAGYYKNSLESLQTIALIVCDNIN